MACPSGRPAGSGSARKAVSTSVPSQVSVAPVRFAWAAASRACSRECRIQAWAASAAVPSQCSDSVLVRCAMRSASASSSLAAAL
jgi:hypothetical protein